MKRISVNGGHDKLRDSNGDLRGGGMEQKYTPGRALAALIGAYHVIVGLVIMFSGQLAIQLAKSIGGMTIIGSPELGIVGEILACYILAFGLMMVLVAWNPVKNRALISVGLVLFVLRVFQRLYFGPKVMAVFQVAPSPYWSEAAVVALLGILLGLFRWQIHRDLHPLTT
jgi:hypothetical protein